MKSTRAVTIERDPADLVEAARVYTAESAAWAELVAERRAILGGHEGTGENGQDRLWDAGVAWIAAAQAAAAHDDKAARFVDRVAK